MELRNEFRVNEPVERAWEVLTDVERIAPCLPGAELQEVVDDEYRGVVRVKVGPITAQYKGAARFLEKDDDAHRAVLRAEGRETRGQGNANATVTAELVRDGDGTKVSVVTDLMITGKVAQFGRGVLADVSSKLLDQFVACLEQKLEAGGPGSGTSASGTAGAAGADGDGAGSTGSASAKATAPAAPVDLLDAAGAPVAKRVLPIAVATAAVLWVLRRVRRGRRRRRAR
ncbi:MAG: SRPBCC family protein [Acidimicrobiales bacterium]